MSISRKVWSVLAAIWFLACNQQVCLADDVSSHTDHLNIGFYTQSIVESASLSDIQVSLNFWAKEILANEAKKKYKLNITQTQSLLFDDMTLMQQAFRNGELDMIVAPPLTISKYFKRDELTTGFIGMLEGNQSDSIYIIVRTDLGINTIAGLKGKSFELMKNDELTEMFVDYVFLKQFNKSYNAVLGAFSKQAKASRIVLDIYFKKVDAGVVFKEPYRVMTELNPDIANQIKILDSYPSLSRNVSFFRKDYVYAQQIKDVAKTMVKDNPRTKQILELFRTPELVEFEVKQLDQFDQFNKDYQTLKQKYAP